MFSDPDNDLPFTTLDRLVKACVNATGCELFGLRVGARMQPTAVGLTGLVSMHAPTVRDALQVLSSTLKISNTGVATALDVRGQIASFEYVVTAPNIGAADQIVDAAIAMVVNTIRRLCGPAWRPKRVRLSREPPRDRTPFAKFYKVPIEYGALTAGVIFDAAALDWPVRDRDPDYAKILTPLLAEAAANAEGDFVSAVKSVLRARIGAGSLTRDSVCRALGLNARTLAPSARGVRRHFLGPGRRGAVRRRSEPIAQGPARRRGRRRARFRRAQRIHPRVQVLVGDDAGAMARRAQRPPDVSGRQCRSSPPGSFQFCPWIFFSRTITSTAAIDVPSGAGIWKSGTHSSGISESSSVSSR